jgi:GTP-binding protein EngB required for normal cell division
MAVEYLILRDFQKHRRRKVVLSPRITTFVGRSDLGKSSFLRALRWLALNRPGGAGFVNWEADSCRVTAGVDGKVVRRGKGKKGNYYKVDGDKYVAFGTEVPAAVRDLFRVDEYNFQRQHDPPFWFTLSPGQVSRELNSVVNLEQIDASLAYLAAEAARAKGTIGLVQERLTAAAAKVEALAWVEQAEVKLGNLEKLHKLAEEKRQAATQAAELLEAARKATEATRRSSRASEELQMVAGKAWAALTLAERVKAAEGLLAAAEAKMKELDALRAERRRREEELRRKAGGRCPVCAGPLKGKNDVAVE